MSQLRDQVTEYKNFTIAVKDTEIQPQMYRNPFDIGRSQLIDQLARMRANFLQVIFLLTWAFFFFTEGIAGIDFNTVFK